MPYVKLLHPVRIGIRQLLRAQTIDDPDFREPVQAAAYGPVYEVWGQMDWTEGDQRMVGMTRGGPRIDADGGVMFRRSDLVKHAFGDLKQGDQILYSGSGPTRYDMNECSVIRAQPAGHYTERRGATLLKVWFASRGNWFITRGR